MHVPNRCTLFFPFFFKHISVSDSWLVQKAPSLECVLAKDNSKGLRCLFAWHSVYEVGIWGVGSHINSRAWFTSSGGGSIAEDRFYILSHVLSLGHNLCDLISLFTLQRACCCSQKLRDSNRDFAELSSTTCRTNVRTLLFRDMQSLSNIKPPNTNIYT